MGVVPAKAVLDSNVLFSRVLHELLGRLASTGDLLEFLWSEELIRETTRVLIEDKGLDREGAEVWVGFMTDAFPAGRVEISQIPSDLDLSALTSDEDDQYICALAVAGGADCIVTFDKSFDTQALGVLGVDVATPDTFLCKAIDEGPELFREILVDQAAAWGGRTVEELIDAIERAGAPVFAAKARKLFTEQTEKG
jgi:predicted nucleic acid-binding protein